MKVLDLFSGIGGFSLGLERAGFKTVAFCEIEPYCRAVLKKHWTDVPQYDDVRTMPAISADVVCGGFPCQPFSISGKHGGKNDDRYLWPAMRDVIEKSGASWVVCENSAEVLRMVFDEIASDLEAIGYEVGEPLVIPACAVNADHRRDRAWICANSNKVGLQGGGKKTVQRLEILPRELAGIFESERSRRSISKPGMLRSYRGISYGVDRIKAIGNSVNPVIPEIIGRAIMQAEGIV